MLLDNCGALLLKMGIPSDTVSGQFRRIYAPLYWESGGGKSHYFIFSLSEIHVEAVKITPAAPIIITLLPYLFLLVLMYIAFFILCFAPPSDLPRFASPVTLRVSKTVCGSEYLCCHFIFYICPNLKYMSMKNFKLKLGFALRT